MRRIARIALIGLGIGLGVVWISDYVWLQYQVRSQRGQQTVLVDRYYAVPRKDGRFELVFQNSEYQTCVQSLFPHLGYEPCWYLRRHHEQRVEL